MGANSEIEWTHHTFNPWYGCTKVSPGCDHCYAESWAKRSGLVAWNAAPRRAMPSKWKEPLKWNREADAAGVRERVFCASLGDVFDNQVPDQWRMELFQLIWMTPHLDWLLLTKRIGNVRDMLPPDWGDGWPHVWLGASIVNQAEADRDIVKLITTPARVRFLSMEPLLGPVALANEWLTKSPWSPIDWVIVGGESGRHARPMEPNWAFEIISDCVTARVPVFFKQGSQANWKDFKNFDGFPLAFKIREWPQTK